MTNTKVEQTETTKSYSCFVCSNNSNEKGLPLMISETSYSQICLGKKLQEILGDKLVILVNQNDSVCWKCATFINKYDKFEFELDFIRDYILNAVLVKYNCKYEDLKEVIEDGKIDGIEDFTQFSLEDEEVKSKFGNVLKTSRVQKGEKAHRIGFNSVVKVKSESVGNGTVKDERKSVHDKSKEANNQFQCSTCQHCFPTLDIYEKHVKLHNLAKSRFYKCKVCSFSSSNLEMYCRHICSLDNNQFISCVKCKRSFLEGHMQTDEDGESMCKQCYERKDMRTGRSILPGTDVTITHRPTHKEQPKFKVLQAKERTKPKLVRKLTTEGAIEYEEQLEAPVDGPLSNLSTDKLDNAHGLEVVTAMESLDCVDDTLNSGFAHTTHSDNVVYLYEDKNLPKESNTNAEIKLEPEDENVREIVVPDHLLEQISSKTGRSTPYMLKCSNCEEVMDVRQLSTHKCFLELEAVEFFEVENALEIDMGLTKKEPEGDDYSYTNQEFYPNEDHLITPDDNEMEENYQPRLLCKTCFQQFPSITLLREHWQNSGHAWEVGTVNVHVKTIKDKVKDNEQTFKVVKQMFAMKANIPAQNNVVESDYTDEHIYNIKNMFVKVRANNECETCGKMFPSEEIMKDHQVDECLSCVYCGIRFLRNDLLKKHYMCTGHWRKIMHDQDPSTRPPLQDNPACHFCGKEFYSRYNLCTHLKTHYSGTNKGFCHFCFQEFEDKYKILEHIIETHNGQLYKCNHCEMTFLTETKRDKHEMIKHKVVECRLCSTKFKSLTTLFKHNDYFHREKSCKICGQFFKSWQSLKRHEKRHSYEQSLKCDLCYKTFNSKVSLKVHNSTLHKKDLKFYCSSCNTGFVDAPTFLQHKKLHKKCKNVCKKCGRICSNKTQLWRHRKKHLGPYSCSICQRIFRDTALLAIHRRTHLKARRYQCPHCPKLFSIAKTLKEHVVQHSESYPYRCTLCRRIYNTKKCYNKHLSEIHKMKYEGVEQSTECLSLNATDEDIVLAADTFISDDVVLLNGYQNQKEDSTITEVVVETTELFDKILT